MMVVSFTSDNALSSTGSLFSSLSSLYFYVHVRVLNIQMSNKKRHCLLLFFVTSSLQLKIISLVVLSRIENDDKMKIPATASSLPHILFIVTDQFRHDAFHPDITPNLYTLSQQHDGCTFFTNAYSSTPTCTPARAGLLTGKSPWNHGMLGYATYTDCSKYPTTLPSILKGYYDTNVVGKNHFGWFQTNHSYITQGYEHLHLYEGLPEKLNDDDYNVFFRKERPGVNPLITCGLGWNDWQACAYELDEYLHPTAWTTQTALDVIDHFDFGNNDNNNASTAGERSKDDVGDDLKKMFLKVSYHRPHSPYDPPKRLFEKYLKYNTTTKNPPYTRFVNNTSWDKQYKTNEKMPHDAWYGDPGHVQAHKSRAGYLANAEFVDEGIGQILETLKEQNVLDQFLIIWTADHGDMNGDHNLWRKGYAWEKSSHVPMMICLPKKKRTPSTTGAAVHTNMELVHFPPTKTRTSQAIVENRDIAPTIYDALGILQQVQKEDPLMNGKSLLPILKGQENTVRDWLDLEHSTLYRPDVHWNAIVGYATNSTNNPSNEEILWKYIFNAFDGSEQLFNLTNDPDETYDLAVVKEFNEVLGVLRQRMVKQFEDEGRGFNFVKDGKLVVRKKPITFGHNFPCNEDRNHLRFETSPVTKNQ